VFKGRKLTLHSCKWTTFCGFLY